MSRGSLRTAYAARVVSFAAVVAASTVMMAATPARADEGDWEYCHNYYEVPSKTRYFTGVFPATYANEVAVSAAAWRALKADPEWQKMGQFTCNFDTFRDGPEAALEARDKWLRSWRKDYGPAAVLELKLPFMRNAPEQPPTDQGNFYWCLSEPDDKDKWGVIDHISALYEIPSADVELARAEWRERTLGWGITYPFSVSCRGPFATAVIAQNDRNTFGIALTDRYPGAWHDISPGNDWITKLRGPQKVRPTPAPAVPVTIAISHDAADAVPTPPVDAALNAAEAARTAKLNADLAATAAKQAADQKATREQHERDLAAYAADQRAFAAKKAEVERLKAKYEAEMVDYRACVSGDTAACARTAAAH